MESSRKRKAPASTPSSTDGSASKRLRLLNSSAAPTAKSSVQEIGQRIVDQLKRQEDKTGRNVAIEFIELPDPDELPEYYEIIKLPVSLESIEQKVKRNEYATVSAIEGDLKRLVQNAKDFNSPDSQIFEDAERIRKLVFNFMKLNNPAYKDDPKYSAVATPLPEKQIVKPVQNGTRTLDSGDERSETRQTSERPKRAATEQSDRKPSAAPSGMSDEKEEVEEEDGDEEEKGKELDMTGMTFQAAQQAIVAHLLHYIDDDGLEIYSPFANLPSRKLEDYYKAIRHPVCIKGVAKRCRGQHGRNPPTGVTDFKSWDMFADEVSFIWRNAKDYNEDGSDMYTLAEEFEEHFKALLSEAREKVDEPAGPRLKIGGPKPKVMLNLSQSQNRTSPAPAPAPLGVTVDDEALARQKQLVQSATNGVQSKQPLTNGDARPGSQPTGDAVRPPSSARSGSPLANVVKSETASTQSPALTAALPVLQPPTNGMMPPPTMRPSSGSPYPGPPPVNSFHYVPPAFLPPTQVRSYPKEAALLPTVTIATHPNLKVAKPLNMSIAPHATLSHQSTTTTLPNTHYFLQISATISKQLTMGRPYKIFVSVNGTRLTQKDTQLHPETQKRTHVYEGSLMQGVNRVEVEVVAAKLEAENAGTGTDGEAKGLDVEKITVFANLMR